MPLVELSCGRGSNDGAAKFDYKTFQSICHYRCSRDAPHDRCKTPGWFFLRDLGLGWWPNLVLLPSHRVVMNGEWPSGGPPHELCYVSWFVAIKFVGYLELLKYVVDEPCLHQSLG